MKTITTDDAVSRLQELVEYVGRGETFELTKNGQPVARLVPIQVDASRNASQEVARAAAERLKALAGPGGKLKTDFRALAHEGHKY